MVHHANFRYITEVEGGRFRPIFDRHWTRIHYLFLKIKEIENSFYDVVLIQNMLPGVWSNFIQKRTKIPAILFCLR